MYGRRRCSNMVLFFCLHEDEPDRRNKAHSLSVYGRLTPEGTDFHFCTYSYFIPGRAVTSDNISLLLQKQYGI